MALVGATTEQFYAFLSKYCYSTGVDQDHALPLSFAFMSTLPFCDDVDMDADRLVEAQCFIAYSISSSGGGFNPTAIAEAKTLTKKNLGRSAIVKEWSINESLVGTDPVTQLMSMPLAYGLLRDYLCDTSTNTAGMFVV